SRPQPVPPAADAPLIGDVTAFVSGPSRERPHLVPHRETHVVLAVEGARQESDCAPGDDLLDEHHTAAHALARDAPSHAQTPVRFGEAPMEGNRQTEDLRLLEAEGDEAHEGPAF